MSRVKLRYPYPEYYWKLLAHPQLSFLAEILYPILSLLLDHPVIRRNMTANEA